MPASSKENIHQKLYRFQQLIYSVDTNVQGYGYKYASLLKIRSDIQPHLERVGLVVSQLYKGKSLVTTVASVDDGSFIESEIDIEPYIDTIPLNKKDKPSMNKIQWLGSVTTYLRRYQLASILGIVTEEDTDGIVVAKITSAQYATLNRIIGLFDKEQDKLMSWIYKDFGVSDIKQLSEDNAEKIITTLNLKLKEKGKENEN